MLEEEKTPTSCQVIHLPGVNKQVSVTPPPAENPNPWRDETSVPGLLRGSRTKGKRTRTWIFTSTTQDTNETRSKNPLDGSTKDHRRGKLEGSWCRTKPRPSFTGTSKGSGGWGCPGRGGSSRSETTVGTSLTTTRTPNKSLPSTKICARKVELVRVEHPKRTSGGRSCQRLDTSSYLSGTKYPCLQVEPLFL